MSSLLFYLILVLMVIVIVLFFLYQRKQSKKGRINSKIDPVIDLNFSNSAESIKLEHNSNVAIMKSVYDPNLIVLQTIAPPGKSYMGYELLQTLLSVGARFGEMNIFHRYDSSADNSKILFSIAAATSDGLFPINEMGSFKCDGLIIFMRLEAKQKLMARFDLMLDVARQLVEELGGEIYDDLHQAINATAIRRLREKICTIETNNLYVADLLDSLD